MSELIFKEEAYQIVGAAYEVYNQLGSGFLEAVYQEALEIEFKLRGIPAEAQMQLHICYKEYTLQQTYRPDFVVYGSIYFLNLHSCIFVLSVVKFLRSLPHGAIKH